MFKISSKAMDKVLARERRDKDYHRNLEERIFEEAPLFVQCIEDSGDELKSAWMGDVQHYYAGYKSGAYITFSMIEEQARLDDKKLPKITEEVLEKMDSCAEVSFLKYGKDFKIREIERITRNNSEFGRYVLNCISSNSFLNESAKEGFALGIIMTYTMYESAYGTKDLGIELS